MVNKINYRVFISPYVNKQGKSKLYVQISINRKIRRYPLNISIDPGNFDKEKMIVASGTQKDNINRIINRELRKIDDIYLYLRETNQEINFFNFENKYFNRDITKISKVIDLHCKSLNYTTWQGFNTLKRELIGLFGDIPINDIDLLKINEFNTYLQRFKNNTAWTKHKRLKSLINSAIKYDIYKKDNPYNNFKFKYIQTKRTFLSLAEIKQIESSLEAMPEPVNNVAFIFLFQCYTGLRYSDVVSLKKLDIQNNFIIIKMKKTNELVSVPVTNKAQNIIDIYKHAKDLHKVFKVPSNQKFNDYLKLVAHYARIDKNLTSHVARHTFATISIELGIPIEIISKILGHKELKTTKIYSQILNPVLSEYMKRWD